MYAYCCSHAALRGSAGCLARAGGCALAFITAAAGAGLADMAAVPLWPASCSSMRRSIACACCEPRASVRPCQPLWPHRAARPCLPLAARCSETYWTAPRRQSGQRNGSALWSAPHCSMLHQLGQFKRYKWRLPPNRVRRSACPCSGEGRRCALRQPSLLACSPWDGCVHCWPRRPIQRHSANL